MVGRTSRLLIALFSSLPVLVATSARAATPNGDAIIAQSFALASHKTSMTLSGTLKEKGITLSIHGAYTPKGSDGVTTVNGIGSSDEVQPNGAKYGYVRANSIAALNQLLEIKNPKSSEVNVWYKVTSTDSRFADFFGGANTVAQTFSFGPIGWFRTANYEGITEVKGVQVFALVAGAHLFVEKKGGFNETTLYVTDSAHPLPFAMTGPLGMTGLIYFTKWNSTTLSIPTATTALPH
jgi:hypothetical protein